MSTPNRPLIHWIVYDHPKEFPECFVARKFLVTEDGVIATDDIIVEDTLEAVRQRKPDGLTIHPRMPDDQEGIVENWAEFDGLLNL